MAVTDKKSKAENNAVSALMTAALALPGVSAEANTGNYRSPDPVVNYHQAKYDEQGNRMSVETQQVSLTVPVARDYEVNMTVIEDITSGASPVVNFLDIDGDPHQFVETGASIKDKRDIYETTLGYYGDDQYGAIKLGRSAEDDYESNYGNLSYRFDLDQKRTSLQFGVGLTSDEVWNSYNPNVLLEEPSVFKRRKKKEFMLGVGQIINRNTTAQFNITYVRNTGSLSDPYKKAYVVDEGIIDFRNQVDIAGLFQFLVDFGVIEALNESGITKLLNDSPLIDVVGLAEFVFGLKKDNRPDVREQWIYLIRTSHYFQTTNSALHFDYRYSDDSWGVDSHTLELKWNIGLGLGWQVSPGVRYYSQHSAFFYDVFFESLPDDGYISTDYRLAGFGAISKKLGISKEFGDYTFYIDYENYDRQYDYEIDGSSKGNAIDDYRFKMLSLSVDAKF